MERVQATGRVGKRKGDPQDNERLAKRLSLLNLERNGEKLYVPVEQRTKPPAKPRDDDVMQLDDSKHKVYIYDLDAELSDSEASDDGRLIFLPDIEKHLRQSRIPSSILANSEGELAGEKQLVLYNVPSSLTVPEAQDSVRKAILETRARTRAKEGQQADAHSQSTVSNRPDHGSVASCDWFHGTAEEASPTTQATVLAGEDDPDAMDLE